MQKAILFAYLLVAALPALAVLGYREAMDSLLAFVPLMALSYWPSFLAPVMAPALVAGAIAGERERRTWDLLVVTQLTPAQIIWGKLLSRLMPLLWITIPLVLPTAVLLVVAGRDEYPWPGRGWTLAPDTWLFVITAWFSGLMVTFANAVMALYVSFRCSSTRAALVIAYGVAVAGYVLVTMLSSPFLMVMLTEVGANHSVMWDVAPYAPPILWGLLVPAILLPLMIRRFSSINSRVRAA